MDLAGITSTYETDGVVGNVAVLSSDEAAMHRKRLEAVEAELGSLHYINKIHTVMASPYELVTSPAVLDVVESLIGPDILLYNSTYIIKEPHTDAYVAWHQDLTYWGLSDDDAQVSMWLAIAPAPVESGCMVMVPGSHKAGLAEHVERPGDGNVLLLGQQIVDVDVDLARPCSLEAGKASFHHGWTIHTSAPNTTDDRRIGLNVQFVAPHNRQAGEAMTATLVRGEDRFGYYETERSPTSELDQSHAEELFSADAKMKASFKTK